MSIHVTDVVIAAAITAIPATIAASAAWRQSKKSHKQLVNNGGNSMRDKLDSVSTAVDQLTITTTATDMRLGMVERTLSDWRHADANTSLLVEAWKDLYLEATRKKPPVRVDDTT